MMDIEKFMDAVVAMVPKMTTAFPSRYEDTHTCPSLKSVIDTFHKAGYSVEDAAAYCLCFEEVSPEMDEETALRRMADFREKYPRTV